MSGARRAISARMELHEDNNRRLPYLTAVKWCYLPAIDHRLSGLYAYKLKLLCIQMNDIN